MDFRVTQTLFVASVSFLLVSADLNGPVVHTELGSVRGGYVSVKGKETGVHAFLGVPFAKPPVGPALRMAAPQPVEGWEGVRDATKQPPICVQHRPLLLELVDSLGGMQVDLPDISEDCLYLNIYTPAKADQNAKLPVMVWIHGGGFTLGSASIYDGSALAAYQDVVVVLIQYRLGIMGFISTDDEHMSGNFGLLDQVEALRWVQQHIHHFGGDPGLVTIFGESAGGVSVSLLLLSPLSDGLFHRAIAESGTAAMDAIITDNALPLTKMLVNLTGCSMESTEEMSNCLRNLDLDALVPLTSDLTLRFPVNIDGHFLKKPVDELFRNHELLTIPFMTGVNDDEGGWLLPKFLAPPNWTEGIDAEVLLPIISMFFPDIRDETVKEIVAVEYLGTGEDRVKNRDGFTELLGDALFNIPAIKTANVHRDAGAPVYLYQYKHSSKFLQALRPSFVGSDHGDEVFTVLGFCFTTTHVTIQDPCDEEDAEISRTMMSYWGNFARTGSPNGDGLVQWPKYGAEEDYLAIGIEQVPAQHLKQDRFIFMTQTLPEKIRQHKETMERSPVVHTELGSVRGGYVSVKGKETGVHAFLGVPFAKPPVGPALRMAAPQPVEGWEGVRDATKQPPICVQHRPFLVELVDSLGGMQVDLPDISEDCLYLNIYTPAKAAQDAKLPVMVWIHGGGFTLGSASIYDGSALAAYQDVVVVLIQYRLGIMGFISTDDEHMSGNFGLLDQVEALRWVQQHIHHFGGDPGLVTIFGESAGGVSVSLLLLSPLSDGLFHRAIAESGTAAMDALITDNALPLTKMLVNLTGCSMESTEEMSNCLRNLDLDALVPLTSDLTLRFPVNIDGHFLKKPVDELFRNHELLTIPFMTGVNDDEGGWLLPKFFAPPNWTEGIDAEVLLPIISMFFPDIRDETVKEIVAVEYLGTGEDRVKNRDGFTELLGDALFNIPAIKTANVHRDAGAPVYLYQYKHSSKFLQALRPSFVGSDHGDEVFTVLGFCFTTTHVTIQDLCDEEDAEISRTMMSYWGNFARTGSPNGDGLVQWPKYGAEEDYLAIGIEQVPAQHLKQDRFIFMTQTLPEKIRQHKETMERSPVVHTELGSVRGGYVSVKGKETGVHAFLGVPFAKPPVGPALRMAAPQPVEGWEGVRDATKQPPICVQHRPFLVELVDSLGGMQVDLPDISEDCLYLNIYTPAKAAQDAKLPVMVWIHGGGFTLGSASIYDGSALAAYQDVVVVLIQYRLGIMGFISTDDEHMSGNFGLLDQVEALRWVQQHIHHFGGDPGLVTIFGESAGGVSVSLLLLSPLSDGLFHRAIAESGTAAMDAIITDNALPLTKMLVNLTGCSMESTEEMSNCLRNLDLDALVPLTSDLTLRFPVNIDGHFLKKPVDELFRNHELLTIPFMTGVNDDEGGWLLPKFFAPPNWTEGIDAEVLLPIISMFFPDIRDETVKEIVAVEYLGTGEDRVKNRDGFTELLGDALFNIPAIKTANVHRDAGAPVYLYQYKHSSKFLQALRPSFVGSDHGDEVFTVLGFCFTTTHVTIQDPCDEEDAEISRTMMSYWGNFARTGSPNGDGLVQWPKYGAEEDYLAIGIEQVPAQHLKQDRFIFMTQTLPEKIRQHKETMERSPVVHTELGSVRGGYVSVKGKETGVHAFLGVPFAKPPVGPALRMAAPQPVEGWEGVRDATKQPPICVQHRPFLVELVDSLGGMQVDLPDISEDCLYLNIYTPAKAAQDAKLPVMVWIHGGGFTLGSASIYDGSALAAYQDVVVVLIQYRLGVMGFISTDDEHMSGNFGLLDQVEALRWVQQHIHHFGGDPGLVTIFGESAGGVSVSLLLLSPLSDGLFHRAIAESGTAAMDAIITDNALPLTKMLVNLTGCSMESTEEMSNCLRNLDLDALVPLTSDLTLRFPVNIDGHFLKKPVDELFRNHELLTIPFMTGVNDDEGGWLITKFFAPPNWTEGIDAEVLLPIISMFFPDIRDETVKEIVAVEYLGTGEDRVKNRDGFTELLGDALVNIPAIKTANVHRDAGAPVYLYQYKHSSKFLQAFRPSFVGSDHGDEVFTVLGFCFTTTHVTIQDPCDEEDAEISRTMMSYWGNFARTGSPNGDGLVQWPKYGAEEDYLAIGIEQVPAQHLKQDRFIFMTQTLPEKIRQHKERKERSEL
ncbi:uncharacterized protein ces2b [Genypterus blacodes]|uniref:uncharacterized protein ces2b n=1 Tax=Genypterus blacodes TaxID=154954 RepID=UPI003F758876